MKKKKFTFIFGTRPEVIKLAPVILEAKRRGHRARVVLTGQHRHLALPLLKFFGIKPDLDLNVMSHDQTLAGLSWKLLESLEKHEKKLAGDFVITQGDTTSAFVSSYWAFCRGIPVAHVEAGLRTFQLRNPFPEEGNRQLIGRLADLHFAPTERAVAALKKENVPASRIHRVGNTSIDALLFTLDRLRSGAKIDESELVPSRIRREISGRRLVLVTAHRRESFGQPFHDMCQGILKLVAASPDLVVVYPVHPNPHVRKVVNRALAHHPQILLVDPLPYVAFVSLMREADLILTDSGGVQEEVPSLRKPILVMRETSERPEGIKLGFTKLVGTNPGKIVREGLAALQHGCRGKGANPYGDGKSAQRIVHAMEKFS